MGKVRLQNNLDHVFNVYYILKDGYFELSTGCSSGDSSSSSQKGAEPENVSKTYRFWMKTYPIWVGKGGVGEALKQKIDPV